MSTLAEQVSAIRENQPLGIAGIHFSIITIARALIVCRREAAASTANSTTARPPPTAGSMQPRRLDEFLYEVELRRSDRVGTARATLRRLTASLLFWLPPDNGRGARFGGEADGPGGGGGIGHRPPGYGRLPRPVVGHEKTALSQFQVKTQERGAGVGASPDERIPQFVP